MDLDRLSTGEKIAGASAVLLFVFMFFDWFTVNVSAGGSLFSGSVGGDAWEAFDLIDIFLLITIVLAVTVAALRFTDADLETAIPVQAVVAVLGAISFLLIFYRIVDPPGGGEFPGISVDVNPAVGAFLGLVAAAGIAYGGYRGMREEGVGFGDVADRLSAGGRGPGTGGSAGTGGGGSGPAAADVPPPPASTPPPPPPASGPTPPPPPPRDS